MRIASIVLAVLILLLSSGGMSEVADSADVNTNRERSENVVLQSSAGPFSWFPTRPAFTTLENEPVLVAVFVDCTSGSQDHAKVEFLEPTPAFVQLRPLCFSTSDGMALVAIAPGEGDAGKHRVRIRAIPCDGPGGIIEFTVKVKKAR